MMFLAASYTSLSCHSTYVLLPRNKKKKKDLESFVCFNVPRTEIAGVVSDIDRRIGQVPISDTCHTLFMHMVCQAHIPMGSGDVTISTQKSEDKRTPSIATVT